MEPVKIEGARYIGELFPGDKLGVFNGPDGRNIVLIANPDRPLRMITDDKIVEVKPDPTDHHGL